MLILSQYLHYSSSTLITRFHQHVRGCLITLTRLQIPLLNHFSSCKLASNALVTNFALSLLSFTIYLVLINISLSITTKKKLSSFIETKLKQQTQLNKATDLPTKPLRHLYKHITLHLTFCMVSQNLFMWPLPLFNTDSYFCFIVQDGKLLWTNGKITPRRTTLRVNGAWALLEHDNNFKHWKGLDIGS